MLKFFVVVAESHLFLVHPSAGRFKETGAMRVPLTDAATHAQIFYRDPQGGAMLGSSWWRKSGAQRLETQAPLRGCVALGLGSVAALAIFRAGGRHSK